MKFDRDVAGYRVSLSTFELLLLKRALERASFIDTPASEQEKILAFCAQALDAIGDAEKSSKSKGD